jgi:hypothetical protein
MVDPTNTLLDPPDALKPLHPCVKAFVLEILFADNLMERLLLETVYTLDNANQFLQDLPPCKVSLGPAILQLCQDRKKT